MVGSAAEIKLLEYKDTITQLNTLLTAQTELNRSLQKTVEDLRQDNKNLMEQIDYLTKNCSALQIIGTDNTANS